MAGARRRSCCRSIKPQNQLRPWSSPNRGLASHSLRHNPLKNLRRSSSPLTLFPHPLASQTETPCCRSFSGRDEAKDLRRGRYEREEASDQQDQSCDNGPASAPDPRERGAPSCAMTTTHSIVSFSVGGTTWTAASGTALRNLSSVQPAQQHFPSVRAVRPKMTCVTLSRRPRAMRRRPVIISDSGRHSRQNVSARLMIAAARLRLADWCGVLARVAFRHTRHTTASRAGLRSARQPE
jgi:hypothetical protein